MNRNSEERDVNTPCDADFLRVASRSASMRTFDTPIFPQITQLKVIPDWRGKLCVLEESTGLPFNINRVYFLYDVPSGSERGGHAHHELQQYLIAISGSFAVDVVTSKGNASFRLDRPDQALHIGPYTWREIHGFSSNAVCLVLASHAYSEADYIRSREDFNKLVGISG